MFRRFALCAVPLLLLPALAWAVDEACVADTNDLAAALLLAQSQPLTIKIKQGTYRLDQTLAGTASGFAPRDGGSLLGGYTGTDCAQRDIGAGNTTLSDVAGSGEYTFLPRGDFSFEGITFNLHRRVTVFGNSANADALISVRRSSFRGSSASNLVAVLWNGSNAHSGTLRIVDTVFQGTTPAGFCSLASVDQAGKLKAYFINDTAVNSNCGLGLYDSSSGTLASYGVYNSVLYGNSVFDLDSNTAALTLVDNVIGSRQSPTPATAPVGTIVASPQLDAGFHPIVPSSPAIDSGTQIVPGGLPSTDLEGSDRVVGAGVDRGAYESAFVDATVQTVTNTSDSGAGSLRQAIINANGHNGANTIDFALTGNCPRVISLNANLDAISGKTTIDGFSQTGASRNTLSNGDDATLCVILESGNAAAANGLRVASGAADSVQLNVYGLGFSGFSGDALGLIGGSQHRVAGNHFGGVVGGHTMLANGVNIRLGSAAHDATIGGDDRGQRNLIGGASGAGVFIAQGSEDNQVNGNFIGVGYGSAFVARGNGGAGIFIAGIGNQIQFNVIGANQQQGVDISGSAAAFNSIFENYIGDVSDTSRPGFGNGQAGVIIENSAHHNYVDYNFIGYNNGPAVRVVTGQNNTILQNNFYGNQGLGIDLDALGVLPNSPDSTNGSTDFANRGQNFPVLTSAIGGALHGRVSGTLSSTPGTYRVDLYYDYECAPSGHGQGLFDNDSQTVTIDPPSSGTNNTASFSFDVASGYLFTLDDHVYSATATDSDGNTSEIAACQAYVDDGIFANAFEEF